MRPGVTIHDMPQRSPEWRQVRLGRLTGSCAADMLATIKSGEAASRRNLRVRLALERITGQSLDSDYINAAMQRGIDMEPAALAAFEVLTGRIVQECGFVSLDGVMAGCSPDGICGEGELLSIKCPEPATHLGYLKGFGVPASYVPQMLHEAWITGARVYHFLSFDDRFPAELQTYYAEHRITDDEVADYEQKALAFLAEVDREVEALQTMANLKRQLQMAVSA